MTTTTREAGTTARHLTELLRNHYQPPNRPPAGVFAPEIGSPCGSRRADAIWMPTTVAGGKGDLVGHEIKVSRADVLVELADPTKADPWARYCSRWWLVVAAPALVDGLDIPDAWGVMSPPSGRRTRAMTILRPAPKLTPSNPAPGYARLVAWLLYADHDQVADLLRQIETLKRDIERHQATIATLRAGGAAARRDPVVERLHAILTAVEAHTSGSRHFWRGVDDRVVIAAILDASATADVADAARAQLRDMVRALDRLTADPLRHVRQELGEADRLATSRDAVIAATLAAGKASTAGEVGPDETELAIAVVQTAFPTAAAAAT